MTEEQILEKLLIVLASLFANTALFVGLVVFLGTLAYLVGIPVAGGLLAIIVAIVYMYFKAIMG